MYFTSMLQAFDSGAEKQTSNNAHNLSPMSDSSALPTISVLAHLQAEEKQNDSVLQSSLFCPTTPSINLTSEFENHGNLIANNDVKKNESSFIAHPSKLTSPLPAFRNEFTVPKKVLLEDGNCSSPSFSPIETKDEELHITASLGNASRPHNHSGKSLQGLASAQVNKIAKSALPTSMLLSKDAKAALQKAGTVAVWYIGAMAAAERDAAEQKKKTRVTLLPSDVARGLEAGGWSSIVPLLSENLSSSNSHMKRSRP